MAARDDQRVSPLPGVDVHEGDGVGVLVDDIRRRFTGRDRAEHAVGHLPTAYRRLHRLDSLPGKMVFCTVLASLSYAPFWPTGGT